MNTDAAPAQGLTRNETVTLAFESRRAARLPITQANLLVWLALAADYSGPEAEWSGPWHAPSRVLREPLPTAGDRSPAADQRRADAADRIRRSFVALEHAGVLTVHPQASTEQIGVTLRLTTEQDGQ
jgi:hypothetical protein